jgi:hypothetical protein
MSESRNPFRRKHNKQSLTAAAGPVMSGSNLASPDSLTKKYDNWQSRVISLIDAVPEPAGASSLVRNTLDKVVFNAEGKGLKKPDEAYLNEQLAAFDAGRAGMLIWQIGECFPSWKVNEFNELEWTVYSPLEAKFESGKRVKIKQADEKFYDLPSNEKYFRMWQPDPAFRYKSWSVHKSLLDLMESMYKHQLADTAVADSRLAGAGILYWPTNLPSLPLKDGRPDEGSQEELQYQLQEAMLQSINNRKRADATVPLIVFGDPTTGESFKPEHILMERPDDAKSFAQRMDSYAMRYAKGVELPIESIQGMGPANHWSAWVINEDKWRFYIAPLADLIADALRRNFVAPWLIANGYDRDKIKNIKVVPDGSEITTKPDKSASALKLAEIGGIMTNEAIVREVGFDPSKDLAADPNQANDGSSTRLRPMPAEYRSTSPGQVSS